MLVGCKCGKSKVISRELVYENDYYYVIIECDECGYYWEGDCDEVSPSGVCNECPGVDDDGVCSFPFN